MGEPKEPSSTLPKSSGPVLDRQIDFFAEQNQKMAEKKQKMKKIRKILIIVGSILAVVIIAIVAILIVNRVRHASSPVVEESGSSSDGNSEMVGVQDLNEKIEEVFKPTYSVDESGNVVVSGDIEAAEKSYEAALANPANKKRIDTIYLAQIVFYASLSDNQRIVEIAEKVDPERLNTSEKIKFYNLTYLAYAALGNKEQADRYYLLTREAADKVNGIGG